MQSEIARKERTMKHNKKNKEIDIHPLWEGTVNSLGLYHTDPMGSYTGRPLDEEELPVQDADDL